jgi:hypothetical protein
MDGASMSRSFMIRIHLLVTALAFATATVPALAAPPDPATFSIVAADSETGEVGIAVASKFFAVGSVVPWARAGVGAVATQSYANTTFGPRGLELLERGLDPGKALEVMLRGDDGSKRRQVGIVSASGESATFSGGKRPRWSADRVAGGGVEGEQGGLGHARLEDRLGDREEETVDLVDSAAVVAGVFF